METLLWQVPEHPLAIEAAWALLEEMHSSVQEGFRRLSRGGVEVGGVLFGRHTEGVVRVLAWRPMVCEHTRGPAFLLSNPDQQALIQMLEGSRRDPGLQVLEPVGWFVSHTRSGLRLTADDIDLYNRYFPEPWQISLVFHPHKKEPTRAGFFVREADGRIRSESSYQEFRVDGVREVGQEPAGRRTEGGEVPRTGRQRLEAQRLNRYFRWAWIACAIMVVALAFVAIPKFRQPTAVVEPVQLRLQDAQGQLRMEWDRNSALVQQAEGATLYIKDRTELAHELDRDTLRRGSLTYARVSEDVVVRLLLKRKNQRPSQELARYVGSPVPKVETQELRKVREARELFNAEAQQLREELEEEAVRRRGLEAAVRNLQNQIERGARKKR